MKYKKLSIVVPAYNEENTIEALINKLKQTELGIEKEYIIVDDGSKDSTRSILEKFKSEANFQIIFNENNLGKSESVKKGILASRGDLVVIQDADLELEPMDLKEFLEHFDKSDADVVFGNRLSNKNKYVYKKNYFGTVFLSFMTNIFTYPRIKVWIPDMPVCYKMVKGEIFREAASKLKFKHRFSIDPEITMLLSKHMVDNKHLNFKINKIQYNPRTKKQGKHLKAFKHGFEQLYVIFATNLRK